MVKADRFTGIDFVGRWKTWFSISTVFVIIGLFALIFTAVNVSYGTELPGLNLGIDFTGGTLLTVDFDQEISENQIREILNDQGIDNSSIQLASQADGTSSQDKMTLIVRTPQLSEEQKSLFLESMRSEIGEFEIVSDDSVHAAISKEIRDKAVLSLLIASIAMVLYITYRFELKFGLTAIAAIMHDAMAVIGVFALIRFPVSGTFVAALLTIVGYSINDTIVVYDRIRERLKNRQKESLASLVNTGIAETLPRSINTSFTTLLAVTPILLLGGQTLREFSLAMAMGVLVGTYSSVFIASPLWYIWKDRENRILQAAGRGR